MLKFARNKLVNVRRQDSRTLMVHGVLDDDIYSLEIDAAVSLPDLRIKSISGKWNRWTTPECPRANQFLKEAVGLEIRRADLVEKTRQTVRRKSCRHYANLLVECCQAVEAAADKLSRVSREAAIEAQEPDRERQAVRQAGESRTGGCYIDLHIHNAPASPCSSASVDQMIAAAKNLGLDGICLTDHNHVWDAMQVEELRQKHGFTVLRGNEITTDQGDVVVFGLEKEIQGIITLDALRQEVSAVGGVIILAHPFRGFLTFNVAELGLTPEKAAARDLFQYVDAVEVLNGKVTEEENNLAAEVAQILGLPVTGGSDAHEVEEVGLYATRFAASIRNEQELVSALREGDYSPVVFEQWRAEKGKRK
jgi:predicted metal-dependent phosphoesterase TrpH